MDVNEMILSPEEIFYLGSILQAQYIDYEYVSAMGDIQQAFALYEADTKEKLERKGILEEDFSGNLNVEQNAEKTLKPIFFGDFQSSFEMTVNMGGEEGYVTLGMKCHFYEGTITAVIPSEEGMLIKQTDMASIQEVISSYIPTELPDEKIKRKLDEIDQNAINVVIVVKNMKVGVEGAVDMFIEHDGHFFKEADDETMESMGREELCNAIYQKMKGV